jgi:dolichyl-diphosphooligosaccharide--protein glycosyltransferase
MRRGAAVLAPLALFALAVAVRGLPWRQVFTGGDILFMGNDAYYHLRRIVHSIVNFPATLEFDRYINFPSGARPIWTPIFDWWVAATALPFAPDARATDPAAWAAVEMWAAWVPPLLGGACVVVAWALARRHLGGVLALSSALILSVLSAHVWYSQVGFLDHHAAVALLSTLALASTMALLAADPSTRAPFASIATGLFFASCLLLWPGSLLHVGLLEGGLLIHLATRRDAAPARTTALRFAGVNAAATLLVFPFAWAQEWQQWGTASPLVLSRFQPWFFAVLTAFGLVYASACRIPGQVRRNAVAAALGIALVSASAILMPELVAGVEDAWRWIARVEGFQAQVVESEPLLVSTGHLSLEPALNRLSAFVLIFPLALAWAAHRERHRPPVLLLLGFAAGLFLATLAQKRFFNSLSVPYAIVMAWALHAFWDAVPETWRRSRGRRRAARAALVAAAVGLLLPSLDGWRIPLRNELRAWRGEPAAIWRVSVRQQRSLTTARWLRDETPATSGWLDDEARPEYGVLAPWALGHILEYVARRPTVVNPFGDDLGSHNWDVVQRYYLGGEREAATILDRLGARYVVASHRPGFLGQEALPGAMFYSLYFFDGARRSTLPLVRDHPAPEPLRRHRLLYESPPRQGTGDDGPSSFKVFEFVPGASIQGRAGAGASVRLSLSLETNRGRLVTYEDQVRAGPDGRFAIRVPYANQDGPMATRVAGEYTLECEGDRARVRVGEAQVRAGSVVQAPTLCTGASRES